MKTHRFELQLDGDPCDFTDALFEAGCDDALFGISNGVGFADFAREAESLEVAIRSATTQINSVEGVSVSDPQPTQPDLEAARAQGWREACSAVSDSIGVLSLSRPTYTLEIPVGHAVVRVRQIVAEVSRRGPEGGAIPGTTDLQGVSLELHKLLKDTDEPASERWWERLMR